MKTNNKIKNLFLATTLSLLGCFLAFGGNAFSQNIAPMQSQAPQDDSLGQSGTQEDSVMLVDMEADRIEKRGAKDSTIYLVGNVKFHHNGAIIECDSASRYDDYRMEFFGDVIINQDSAYVYGDRVLYDGRTSIAEVFSPLVKMTRGDVVLYSYNLRFDTRTNTGTYVGGGVLTQSGNLMESERGEFDANNNIVRFKDSVSMSSDTYKISTDSLDYNIDRETATFLAHTTVWDKDSNILMAQKGFYYNFEKRYEFVGDAYILTRDQQMWGDTLSYKQDLRQATFKGNVQLLDTIQKSIAFGDWAFYDDSISYAMLTLDPSIIMYDSLESDKLYIRADTLTLTTYPHGQGPTAYPREENVVGDSTALDSTALDGTAMDDMMVAAVDTTIDTTAVVDAALSMDSTALDGTAMDDMMVAAIDTTVDTTAVVDAALSTDSTALDGTAMDDMMVVAVDSNAMVSGDIMLDSATQDSLVKGYELSDSISSDTTLSNSLATNKVQRDTTSPDRIMRAWHNVRTWNVEYQMTADSMVGYFADSMSSLFGRPRLWNQNNQLTADRIDSYTKDNVIDWVDCIGSPFMTQALEPLYPEPADSSRFNQVSSRSMQASFKNGELDSTIISGNVLNYYYYMDDVGYTAAFATIECPELVVFFKERSPSIMSWRGSTNFAIYPLDQIPADQPQRMEGFEWSPELRPASAEEISNREQRPSQREDVEAIALPSFVIDERIRNFKELLLKEGRWNDRSDQVTVTPEYFDRVGFGF